MNIRNFTLDDLGDPDAPIGSRPWALHISNEIRKTLYDKQQTGARLSKLIEAFKDKGGYQELGFLTWEQFCEARLQITADKLATVATDRVAAMAKTTEPSPPNGANQHNLGVYNYTPLDYEGQGTSAKKLTARIARDHPVILDDMKQGKYKSVRAAAIVAGIIDPEKSRRFQLPTDPAAAGKYLAKHVDAEWMLECYDAFMKEVA